MGIWIWVLCPPVAFCLLFLAVACVDRASRRLAAHSTASPGKSKAYACGEEASSIKAQPNYGEFFPAAFFFIIMHVVALLLATVPHEESQLVGVLALYVAAALSGLFILFGDKIERDIKELLH